jgi:hypothetical protein
MWSDTVELLEVTAETWKRIEPGTGRFANPDKTRTADDLHDRAVVWHAYGPVIVSAAKDLFLAGHWRTFMARITARRHVVVLLAVGTAWAIAACSSATTVPSDGMLALGTWGGDSAGMIVGDTATHLHIKCTFGDISGRVVLNATGGFDARGSYMLRAYPIAIGPPLPARFVGVVSGDRATVTVTVDDTVKRETVVLGPAVVLLGTEPKLWPCPICRRPVVTFWPLPAWAGAP